MWPLARGGLAKAGRAGRTVLCTGCAGPPGAIRGKSTTCQAEPLLNVEPSSHWLVSFAPVDIISAFKGARGEHIVADKS